MKALCFFAAAGCLFAQSTPQPLTFEVASIQPSAQNCGPGGPCRTMLWRQPGGSLRVEDMTLRMLIGLAYDVRDFQISGGPLWVNTDRFDINAKAESHDQTESLDLARLTEEQRKTGTERMRERLRNLLADRFQLVVRREMKEQQAYALVVAKGGPKFRESKQQIDQVRMGSGIVSAHGVAPAILASILSQQLGRPVIDKTGLTGKFDIDLKWTPDAGQVPAGPFGPLPPDAVPPPDPNGPSILPRSPNNSASVWNRRKPRPKCSSSIVQRGPRRTSPMTTRLRSDSHPQSNPRQSEPRPLGSAPWPFGPPKPMKTDLLCGAGFQPADRISSGPPAEGRRMSAPGGRSHTDRFSFNQHPPAFLIKKRRNEPNFPLGLTRSSGWPANWPPPQMGVISRAEQKTAKRRYAVSPLPSPATRSAPTAAGRSISRIQALCFFIAAGCLFAQAQAPPLTFDVASIKPSAETRGTFTQFRPGGGLRLESQKGPVEMLVIDRAEKPREN